METGGLPVGSKQRKLQCSLQGLGVDQGEPEGSRWCACVNRCACGAWELDRSRKKTVDLPHCVGQGQLTVNRRTLPGGAVVSDPHPHPCQHRVDPPSQQQVIRARFRQVCLFSPLPPARVGEGEKAPELLPSCGRLDRALAQGIEPLAWTEGWPVPPSPPLTPLKGAPLTFKRHVTTQVLPIVPLARAVISTQDGDRCLLRLGRKVSTLELPSSPT